MNTINLLAPAIVLVVWGGNCPPAGGYVSIRITESIGVRGYIGRFVLGSSNHDCTGG